MVNDYAEEGGRIFWVSVMFIRDGHQLFKVSFVSRIGGVEVAEKDSAYIPDDAFLLMTDRAIKFFKEKKVFRYAPTEDQTIRQPELPFKEKSP